jgi:hypothetical protein
MPAWTELFNSVALPQVDLRRTFRESRKPWTVEHGLHRLSSELCGTPPRSALEYRRHALTFTLLATCSTPLVLEVIVSASTECPTLRTRKLDDADVKLSTASQKSTSLATGTRVRKSTGRKILRRRLGLLRQTSLLLHWTTIRLSPRNKVAGHREPTVKLLSVWMDVVGEIKPSVAYPVTLSGSSAILNRPSSPRLFRRLGVTVLPCSVGYLCIAYLVLDQLYWLCCKVDISAGSRGDCTL